MDQWTEIRRKVLVEGASKRSIHRDYGIGHQALAKILANAEPPGYQMTEVRRKPVLGRHLATIDQILADDKEAPPKQRHTARRIFDRLRDEHGYTGCYSQVQKAVQRAKATSREVFVPLSHPPGHAPVRLRRSHRRDRRGAGQSSAGCHHAAVLGRLLPLGLPARVHRDLSGRARGGLLLLRWGAGADLL
jgi:hypothetical protein